MKLVTIVGTRPELIRLSRIINEADKYFDHILVHTGQNYDKQLNDIFFDEMKIRKPDYYLNVVGNNLGETMGNVISKSYDLFVKLMPDCLLILGDTNSALCAISAKRLKIPIFHMEAGNRCFDLNVPEEINRKIVDHISDVNLPYTENSRRYLLDEGVHGKYVFVTGTPLMEVLEYYKNDILNSNILNKLELKEKQYILLSCHREENIDIDKNFNELLSSLEAVCDKYNVPIIFSTHPRTKKKLQKNNVSLHPLIRSVEPFGFFDYCNLQLNALCVLSDSGSLSEEASILNFPAVSFRTSTERPEALDKGNIIIGNIKAQNVIDSINISIKMFDKSKNIKSLDYTDSNVSEKVIKIIQSYTPIINKTVWYKN
ncbi:UDP-N-acetylglucosamine 2-epimerase WecB-like protein [Fadolivirus algeromassiliense]|jgi:UDP-N-acetylglucosamine 2-epimerase (non-hydrolysing)|uniref:UDP-N-acetylglucosamine 2-epimerase WecB-like protein n=1 Tax=Fadolivirus FV1/VV64 TaxID=3070911 RepID=A0A7D3QTS5_9VIRU|nr:UDP-N-acetylglucosamine 2-epimerase WecB-like protein [Fadolivirus algeromassiliense]QKF93567.1 UDP-N-acetylglucosamine 2-epimerase WecB-like protein [Fadolivirus FV1/VV64]